MVMRKLGIAFFWIFTMLWIPFAGYIIYITRQDKSMKKILGINSVVMNGSEKTTVTKITSKGVTLKGKKSLTFPLKDVEKQLQAGRWKGFDNE